MRIYYNEERFTYKESSTDYMKPAVDINVPFKISNTPIIKHNVQNIINMFLKLLDIDEDIEGNKKVLDAVIFDSEKKPIINFITSKEKEKRELIDAMNAIVAPYRWSAEKENSLNYILYLD